MEINKEKVQEERVLMLGFFLVPRSQPCRKVERESAAWVSVMRPKRIHVHAVTCTYDCRRHPETLACC